MNKELIEFLRIFLILACVSLAALEGKGQSNAVPRIVRQPADVIADYGANVTLKVAAAGAQLSYEWRKDGVPLADYRNVAGAKSPVLRLVGIGLDDTGEYSVVISNKFGSVTSDIAVLQMNPATAFSDDFEDGFDQWSQFGRDDGLELSSGLNRSAGGKKVAAVSHTGQKIYRNLETEISGRMRASFWIYDDGDPKTRCYAELRGYTGKGYATYVYPGGIQQLIAIGTYVDPSALQNTGTLKEESLTATRYQGRVVSGKNTGWFNLDAPGAPQRSSGWHKFEIEREADGKTVHFYIDGVLGRTITDVQHVSIDSITIGSIGKGHISNHGAFDDVQVEHYPRKFDWQTKDSGKKGLLDWMTFRETGTDPAIVDIKEIKTLAEIPGAAATQVLGEWGTLNGGIYAKDRRGGLNFEVNVPQNDAYRIEIEGREKNFKWPKIALPLIITIDGEFIGRFQLPYSRNGNGVIHCFTPYLTAGRHRVEIYWDNIESHCALFLQAVRLQALQAEDQNKNGLKDWVENRVLSQSGWDSPMHGSRVSPLCLEGRGQYLSIMRVRAGTEEIPVQPGAGHRWYANVPLLQDAPTVLKVSYQNGVLEESAEIRWEPTNLLEADDTTIRKGDALLFTAAPPNVTNGQVSIQVEGVTNHVTHAGIAVPHRFDLPGVYRVTGTFHPTGSSRTITIKVVEAALGDSIAAWANRKRYWGCADLPSDVILEADPRMKFVEVGSAERQPNIEGRQFRITADAPEERYIIARLGVNGPILGSVLVSGFQLYTPLDTYLRLSETHEDGSHSIDGGFIVHPVLPQVSIDLKILVAGITFSDGTVSTILKASDFDEAGICQVRFVRGAGLKTSVCHAAKAYQDGILIGWP